MLRERGRESPETRSPPAKPLPVAGAGGSALLAAAVLALGLSSPPAVAEIILAPAAGASLGAPSAQYNRQRAIVESSRNGSGEFVLSPNIVLSPYSALAPGGSLAAQSAQYNRQRAIVESSRNGSGEFVLSPNIVLSPYSALAPGGSLAAQSAQYNRQRAIVESSRNGSGQFVLSPNILLINGYNSWGGSWVGGGSPAAYGAAYNRQRAVANQVLMGKSSSASSNAARANAYRTQGH